MVVMMVVLMIGTDLTPSHIFRLILYSLLVLVHHWESVQLWIPWSNQLPFNQNLALTESLRLELPCALDAFQSGEWLFLKVKCSQEPNYSQKVKYEEKKLLVLLWIRWVASKGSSFLTAHPGIFMSLMTSMTSIPICSACTADRGIEIKLHHIFSILIALDISSILISLDICVKQYHQFQYFQPSHCPPHCLDAPPCDSPASCVLASLRLATEYSPLL